MLNPVIGELIEKYDNGTSSRYELVMNVARRARHISEKAEREKEIIIEKPVTLAMNALAEEIKENEE